MKSLRETVEFDPCERVLTEETLVESMQRHCEFYLASDGKWYMELAPDEYGEQWDADTYGPFRSEDAAYKYLDNFSNPGGYGSDDTGTRPPPTTSPNGSPVRAPRTGSSYGGMGGGGFGRYRF